MRSTSSALSEAPVRGRRAMAVAVAAAIALSGVAPTAAFAEGAGTAGGRVTIELNHLEPIPDAGGCRISLVANNGLGTDIADIAIEIVIFDAAGTVGDFVRLDLGGLPMGKTRVRQYDLETGDCGFSRILVNEVVSCEGDGLAPDVCLSALATEGRGGVPFVL